MSKKNKIILITSVAVLISAILVATSIVVFWGNETKRNFELGRTLLNQNKYDKALEVFNKILIKDPKNLDAKIPLIKIYTLKRDYNKAEKIMKEISSVDNKRVDAYAAYAFFYDAQEKYDDETKIIEKGILATNSTNLKKILDDLNKRKIIMEKNAVLNQVCNLKNEGYSEVVGDWVFYGTEDGITKMNKHNGNEEVLVSADVNNLVRYKKSLLYQKVDREIDNGNDFPIRVYGIYAYNTVTAESRPLISAAVMTRFYLDGDKIVFKHIQQGLCTLDIITLKLEPITENQRKIGSVNMLTFDGEKFYFSNEKGEYKSIDKNQTSIQAVSYTDNISGIKVDNQIYFEKSNEALSKLNNKNQMSRLLFRENLEDKTKKVLVGSGDERVLCFNIWGKRLYCAVAVYSKPLTVYYEIRDIDIDTLDTKVIDKMDNMYSTISSICISDKWLFINSNTETEGRFFIKKIKLN